MRRMFSRVGNFEICLAILKFFSAYLGRSFRSLAAEALAGEVVMFGSKYGLSTGLVL